MRIFLWLLCFVLLAVIGFGTYLIFQQKRWIASYSATAPATVLDKRLDMHREEVHGNTRPGENRSRVISEPIVTFQFELHGRQITRNNVFPERFRVGGNLGRLFAEAPLDNFEVGQQVTAYYNPGNSTEACLIRRPSIVPYLFLLLPALVVSGLVTYLWQSTEVKRTDFKRRKNRWITVFWHAVGLFSACHYIYTAGADYGGGAIALFGIYTQLGLIPVALALPPSSHSEVVQRIDAGIWGSLLGTFLGFWLGLGIGWLASWLFSASASLVLACWGYGIVIPASLLGIFGLLSKSKSYGRRGNKRTKRKRASAECGPGRGRDRKSVPMPKPDGPIPYGIDQRPMPEGEDLETLLPSQIGPFCRVWMDELDNVRKEQIRAEYRADAAESFSDEGKISFELSVCDGPESAQRGLETSKAETEAEFPEAARRVSLNTEPAFFKSVTPRGTFMTWTRGGYHFSAHARSGEDDLDRFMEAFPF